MKLKWFFIYVAFSISNAQAELINDDNCLNFFLGSSNHTSGQGHKWDKKGFEHHVMLSIDEINDTPLDYDLDVQSKWLYIDKHTNIPVVAQAKTSISYPYFYR